MIKFHFRSFENREKKLKWESMRHVHFTKIKWLANLKVCVKVIETSVKPS